MFNIKTVFLWNYLTIIGFAISSGTYSFGQVPLKATKLSVEHKKIKNKRDPYFPDKGDWTNKTDLLWDVNLYNRVFWENNTYMEMDYAVRHIGWHYKLGISPSGYFDFVWEHHSRHVAEALPPEGIDKFPVEDSYGIRLNFIPCNKGRLKSWYSTECTK